MTPEDATGREPDRPRPTHLALVLLLAAAVYLPALGRGGLTSSEGHRAIPAWTMLEQGGWLVPTLFEAAYLRKPPGMAWGIAATSAVLGQTELAARAVSAISTILLALATLIIAARWFGARAALVAGTLAALLPLYWVPGRTAEIEALNNLATLVAAALLLDMLLRPSRPGPIAGALTGLAIAATVLVKGPAGAPVLLAAIAAACIVRRSLAPLRTPALGIAIAVSAGGIALLWALSRRAMPPAADTVTQTVAEFMWDSETPLAQHALRVAALPIAAIISAAPASLAILFPWWGSGERADAQDARARDHARAVAWTIAIAVALLMVGGVTNPRYAMPALTLTPLLAAYVARGALGPFTPLRRCLARWVGLDRAWIWAAVLLAVGLVYVARYEPVLRAESGRDAGIALARALPADAVVVASDLIDARPEVLWYARRAARTAGRPVRVLWWPDLDEGPRLPQPGQFIILRTDALSVEHAAFVDAGLAARLEPVATGHVHKYDFTLYLVRP